MHNACSTIIIIKDKLLYCKRHRCLLARRSAYVGGLAAQVEHAELVNLWALQEAMGDCKVHASYTASFVEAVDLLGEEAFADASNAQ